MTSIPLPSRQIIISSHNEGPLVNIVSWIGLSTMILGVGARIGSKYLVVRRCSTDDGLIIVAMCFGICHSVFLSMMVKNGLGRYQDTLNSKELEYYQKYAYASQLVYIPTLCFAKLSTLFYLRALTPDSNYAILNRVTEICVILWALCAEVSVAFQCDLPNPWAVLYTDECFNIVSWVSLSISVQSLTYRRAHSGKLSGPWTLWLIVALSSCQFFSFGDYRCN